MAALCRLGELDQARRLTETIDWFYHRTIAVAALIRAQDDPEDALGIADALGDVARERVLPAVAGVLGRAGDHDRAWALIDTIVSEDVRYDAVLAWAGETCVTGDVDQAIEMVLRHGPLRSLSGRTKITAQADALTHLAEEMVVRGEPGLARHLAGQAESLARTAAHTWELSMVLAALAKLVCEAGDVRRAETLARMIDPRESPGVAEPLAGLLSSAGDADLAETLILSGTTVRGFKDALIDLIRRAAATGDVDRIGRLVEHARAIEPPPEGGDREAWALVEVLAAAGELDAAQTAAEAIAPGWIRREAFVHLIRAAGAAGDVERAQVLVAGMDEPAFRDRAEVIALVEGLAAGGHLEKAVEVAQEASSAVFAALVRVVAVRDPHEAVSVAERISAPSHRVRALVAAARATPHARSRFLAEAMRTGPWVRTLPALTGEEKADLLDVVDELNAFRRARPRPPV